MRSPRSSDTAVTASSGRRRARPPTRRSSVSRSPTSRTRSTSRSSEALNTLPRQRDSRCSSPMPRSPTRRSGRCLPVRSPSSRGSSSPARACRTPTCARSRRPSLSSCSTGPCRGCRASCPTRAAASGARSNTWPCSVTVTSPTSPVPRRRGSTAPAGGPCAKHPSSSSFANIASGRSTRRWKVAGRSRARSSGRAPRPSSPTTTSSRWASSPACVSWGETCPATSASWGSTTSSRPTSSPRPHHGRCTAHRARGHRGAPCRLAGGPYGHRADCRHAQAGGRAHPSHCAGDDRPSGTGRVSQRTRKRISPALGMTVVSGSAARASRSTVSGSR